MIALIIGLGLISAGSVWFFKNKEKIKEYAQIKKENKQLELKKKELINSINELNNEFSKLSVATEQGRKAFDSFWSTLELAYEKTEKEHDNNIELLKKSLTSYQDNVEEEKKKLDNELKEITTKFKLAQENILKETLKNEELKNFSLLVSEQDLSDIAIINSIKPKIHNPRVLNMLIWSSYYQKPMTALCNSILGAKTVCGIYKITNLKNNMCYIGQSVDIATRWKKHAKCGLGIDTPVKNKLYKAMLKDGLENFSWEVLQETTKDKLDELENFYIDLYQSKDYGYNSVIGSLS